MTLLKTDVCVIGGGVVGLSVALGLAQDGIEVVVLDGHPEAYFEKQASFLPYDVRVFAMNHHALSFLAHLGIDEAAFNHRYAAYQKMEVWAAGKQDKLEFTSEKSIHASLGWVVEQSVLLSALWHALKQSSKAMFWGQAAIESIDSALSHVKLKTGEVIEASLIVGADGRHSFVRTSLDFKVQQGSYQQSALVANVVHASSHQNTAYQCFDQDEPLAFLPLFDNHHSSIVWSGAPKRVDGLLNMNEAEFEHTLFEASMARLGAVKLISKRHVFPLEHLHLERYFMHQVVLVGDAAHVVHPMAGLGMNLGLLDAACLVECVSTAFKKRRPIGSSAVLRRYERVRRAHNAWVLRSLAAIKFGFKQSIPFGWLNKQAWLKNKIINLAQGAYGLPHILK